MLKSYDVVSKKAVADKVVAASDVFTTADKEVPTQAAQIQNLILQGYNGIVINAGSPWDCWRHWRAVQPSVWPIMP